MTAKEENIFLPDDERYSLPLAMAYVPMQQFYRTFSPEEALAKGTLFYELYKPFCGRTVKERGDGCA